MKMNDIDHVTVAYKDGHSDVFYKHQVKGQRVATEPTGVNAGRGPTIDYITLTLVPRKEQDASQQAGAK